MARYKQLGALAAFWPEAANPEHFYPQASAFEFDVSFIGAKYGIREHLIGYLQKRGIKVATFGPGWPSGNISEQHMVQIYNRSRINLGFGFIGLSKYQCLKGRDFEVPACGALYLTSNNPDLELVYDIGSEIITYSSRSDCYKKIMFLLKDPTYCQEIREAARKRVLLEHSWVHRFTELIYGPTFVFN